MKEKTPEQKKPLDNKMMNSENSSTPKKQMDMKKEKKMKSPEMDKEMRKTSAKKDKDVFDIENMNFEEASKIAATKTPK